MNNQAIIITIVGSREAPQAACEFMAQQSLLLRANDIIVRTGDASRGIDDSVVNSCNYYMATHPDEMVMMATGTNLEVYTANDSVNDAVAHTMASKYHPVWNNLTEYAKLLHARNCYQVAGLNLNRPSNALLCWTPDGITHHKKRSVKTGGTGTAISVASEEFDIPVFNIRNKVSFREWLVFTKQLRLEQ
jgi:hypothetical protein